MSTRWERLAGDTSIFAVKIAFHSDPDRGFGSDAESSASWGTLELWVADRKITAHVSGDDTIGGVRWYLLPILQWFADNWEPLFHEERPPVKLAADAAATSLQATRFPPLHLAESIAGEWFDEWQQWWQRHSLQSCREGGVVPDIIFRRLRDQIEISWQASRMAGVPHHVSFLVPSGCERLDPPQVVESLYTVLSEAAAFLAKELPDSERLRQLHTRLLDIPGTAADREQGRLAWLAGLGRSQHAIKDGWQRVLAAFTGANDDLRDLLTRQPTESRRVLALEGSCHATLLFACVSPEIEERDVLTLARVMIQAHQPTTQAWVNRLRLESDLDSDDKPWEQGYQIAEKFRKLLSLAEDEIPDVDQILTRLGVKSDTMHLADASIHAVTVAGEGFLPTILLNEGRASVSLETRHRRFTVAHELCHLLVDRDRGAKLAIASGPWTLPRVEKRARAFAAAFLMPWAAVRRAVATLSDRVDSLEAVRRIARALDTSELATLERLHDLNFLDDVQRDAVRSEMEDLVAGE
jgi:Zn-dependent peptidase ImmA (M78 family)